MRGSNGVKIAGEMEVNLLHGQHLCVAAACCPTLHAEARAQRGFAQCHNGFLANLVESQRQTDGNGGFTNTRLGSRDGCHQNEVAFLHLFIVYQVIGYFGYVASVILYFIARYAYLFGYLFDLL